MRICFLSECSWYQSAVQSAVLHVEAWLFISFCYFKIHCKKMLFCIKRSFVWLKKIVFDESFYEIVLLLIQFFSCTWLLLFLRAGRLCNVLSDLRLFVYSFDDFFSMIWWNTITIFFPVVFLWDFLSCFFKKRKVFSLLICKKGFCWMNWIVCRLSCRRICFFFWFQFFFEWD